MIRADVREGRKTEEFYWLSIGFCRSLIPESRARPYPYMIIPLFPIILQIPVQTSPCQLVTEFWSGDEFPEGQLGTQGLAEHVDPIDLAEVSTFVFEDTPIVFCFQHFISLFICIIPVCSIPIFSETGP